MTEQREPTGPRQNVKLALYALSGNQCAFPGCDAPVFEEESIVGEICHINARSPGGPRFIAGLSNEELHASANLLLLCRKHAKIIDDHPEEYPAEQLRKMKADHEAHAGQPPASLMHRLIEALAPSEVPVNWWERPGAPVFRLGLASNRPQGGTWTYDVGVKQFTGGDIGTLRYRYRHGDQQHELEDADLRKDRQWRLATLSLMEESQPLELELTFWWEGDERRVTYRWERESCFQRSQSSEEYS